MNVFDLFESPQLGAPSNGIGVQSAADQHSASPIGSGTTKREAKKKPVTMMGVAVKEDIEEGWFDTAAPKNEKWYLKKDGAVLRTVNGEPFTFKDRESALAWAKKTYKVSFDQQRILPTTNPDKNLIREPRAQMEAGKPIKSNFKMPPESLQDKMYRQHQELRKKRGAPSPEEYKQRIAQKQAEIDALKEGILDRAAPKMPKPRNPADQVLRGKVNAAGKHLDKKRRQDLNPKHKHKDPLAEGEVLQFPKSSEDKNVRAKLEQRLLAAFNQIVDYAEDNGIDILEKNAPLYSKLFDKYDTEDATLDPEQAMARNEPIEVVAQVVKEVEHIAKHINEYLENMWGDTFNESSLDEGWKSAVAGAALAGATALGGGAAQAGDLEKSIGPLPVMATIVIQLPDGQTKTIKKDLGHSYDYKIDDAKKDIENLLDKKGIKRYSIHLDRYDSNAAYLDRDVMKSQAKDYSAKSDYVDAAPYQAKGNATDYMDKSPYKASSAKVNYLDKAKSGEFRDMANYESVEEMNRRGFLKALGGAALAGAGVSAADAQNIDLPGPQAVTIVHIQAEVNGREVNKTVSLGTQYQSKEQAEQDVEEYLQSKGITRYNIRVEQTYDRPGYIDSNQPRGGTATGRDYSPGLGDMIAGRVSREIRAGIPSKGGYATGGTTRGQRPRDGSQWWRDQLPQIMKEEPLEEDIERHLLQMRRAGYDIVQEEWSDRYKRSINCSNPKGFSQKAHCAGRKKNEDVAEARDGDTNFGSTVARGSWVVYDGSKVKRFKTRDGAKAYAEKNGGKVASSEFYADNVQKQGVAEEKVRLDPKCWTGKKIGNPKTKMKGGVRVNNCVPK